MRRRSLAQLQCILFQMASFAPKLTFYKPELPRFLAIIGSELNAARARNYGFRPTGYVLPQTGVRLLELGPSALVQYTIMWAVLRAFQSRLGIVKV